MTVELSLNLGTYVDYTEWVDVRNLKRNISLNGDNDPQKSQTGDIEFFGSAYTFIYTNLIDSVNLYSNAVYVKITDTECSGNIYYFKVDNKAVRWCDNNECRISFGMDEYNPKLDCIRNTNIADNTNGEFQAYPTSGNPHPRFRYCDVLKPTWFFGVMVTFFNSIDLLILSLNIMIAILNIIPGVSITPITFTYAKFTGCDRGYPAPYIRTYIDNVCDLCSVDIDDYTDKIFHKEYDQFQPAYYNEYYNACLMSAYTTKGVDMTGNMDYIVSNRPSWSLYDMLSKIKLLWNARWYIHNNKLYINRKDLIGTDMHGTTPAIDLSGADAEFLLGDVCYQWNGQGKCKRINLNYGTDPTDNIGNELKRRFNGEYLDTSGNPNYTDTLEEYALEFGATSFILDGSDTLWDANVVNAIGAVISGFSFDGCLKTQGDTCAYAKILIHSVGTPIDDARVVKNSWLSYIGCQEFNDDVGSYFPVSGSDLYNYNYPMSFSPCQDPISPTGNLWTYWQIDAPQADKKTNIGFEFRLNYCCSYNTLDLYMKVLFQDGVTIGEINSIDFDHYTRQIILKGNLL